MHEVSFLTLFNFQLRINSSELKSLMMSHANPQQAISTLVFFEIQNGGTPGLKAERPGAENEAAYIWPKRS